MKHSSILFSAIKISLDVCLKCIPTVCAKNLLLKHRYQEFLYPSVLHQSVMNLMYTEKCFWCIPKSPWCIPKTHVTKTYLFYPWCISKIPFRIFSFLNALFLCRNASIIQERTFWHTSYTKHFSIYIKGFSIYINASFMFWTNKCALRADYY